MNRETIHKKYNGRCAYCGKDITLKQMQVDHIVPLFRNDTNEALERMGIIRGANTIDNLNPSCARCNRYKSTMTLETFREQISLQVERLELRSWNYRMARDFGLVTETKNQVQFYFETIKKPRTMKTKLTLEKLAPYLPYGLKLKCYTEGYPEEIYTMKTLSNKVIVGVRTEENRLDIEHYHFEDIKPILRPLSDLEPRMFDGEEEDLIGRIIKGHTVHYGSLSYNTIQYLAENHYDFQNLIMKGLAVNINEI